MTSPRPPGRTWLRAAPAGRLRQGHVRRWRWRHCNVSPPRSEMFDSNRRTRAERPSIPASGLLPCVTEDRCRSFWRRSEDEFATISITSSPVSGRISGPKSAVFPGPNQVVDGMFRVGQTKVQTAAKKKDASRSSTLDCECGQAIVLAVRPTEFGRAGACLEPVGRPTNRVHAKCAQTRFCSRPRSRPPGVFAVLRTDQRM
jgi:hypothetical protein